VLQCSEVSGHSRAAAKFGVGTTAVRDLAAAQAALRNGRFGLRRCPLRATRLSQHQNTSTFYFSSKFKLF
jgi:hypothetical protein